MTNDDDDEKDNDDDDDDNDDYDDYDDDNDDDDDDDGDDKVDDDEDEITGASVVHCSSEGFPLHTKGYNPSQPSFYTPKKACPFRL